MTKKSAKAPALPPPPAQGPKTEGATDAKHGLTATLRNLARHHGRKAVTDAYQEFMKDKEASK